MLEKFLISNRKQSNNSDFKIHLNKNFILYTNKKPDILIRGKEKFLFFGKVNGFFKQNIFIKTSNFTLINISGFLFV